MEITGLSHVHSTYSSDGKMGLLEIKETLLRLGISFCCVTEHTGALTLHKAQEFAQECRLLSDSQFVFIPGFEVPYEQAHILFIGTELFLAQKADEHILTRWSERSALTILAHPVRNHFKVDPLLRRIIDGVEIWNHSYDGALVPRPRSVSLLSDLQIKRRTLLAMGGSNLHSNENVATVRYTLSVDHLTVDAILFALQEGAYTFGTPRVQVSSLGLWKGRGSIMHLLLSAFSIMFIGTRKYARMVYLYLQRKFQKTA